MFKTDTSTQYQCHRHGSNLTPTIIVGKEDDNPSIKVPSVRPEAWLNLKGFSQNSRNIFSLTCWHLRMATSTWIKVNSCQL